LEYTKIRSVFKRINKLCTVHDFAGTPDNVVRVLLISQDFKRKLENAVKHISFSVEESATAQEILRRGVFDDAIVLSQDEIPSSFLFNHFVDWLCIEFINTNGRLLPDDEKYISYPLLKGYASSGYSYLYVTTYNTADDFILSQIKHPGFFVTYHDCDLWTCKMKKIDLGDFLENTLHRMEIQVEIMLGKVWIMPSMPRKNTPGIISTRKKKSWRGIENRFYVYERLMSYV